MKRKHFLGGIGLAYLGGIFSFRGKGASAPLPFRFDVNPVTRPIDGTTFTPNANSNVEARYVIELSVTQNVTGTSFTRVLMQFSENGGSTWNDGEEAYFLTTLGVGVVLGETRTIRQTVSGFVPRNSMVRLTKTGGGSATYIRGAENPY